MPVEEQTRSRSVTKGLTWRLVATLTTVLISLQITGHLGTALKVGPADFVCKFAAYYFHERAWLRPSAQRLPRYALLKTCSWKILALTLTTATVYAVTGDLSIAAKLGPADFAAKLGLYAAHEFAWSRLSWGRTVVHLRED